MNLVKAGYCAGCDKLREEVRIMAHDVTAVAGKYGQQLRGMLDTYRSACVEFGATVERASSGVQLDTHQALLSRLLAVERELLEAINRLPLESWQYFESRGVEMCESCLSEEDLQRVNRVYLGIK